ncbi:calcium-binding protein [Paracoccus lichenicola]|nr:calcium-binding protein [Paracoccus lichenicola]
MKEGTETAYLVVDLGYSSVSFQDGGSLKVIEIRILDDNLTTGGTGNDILRGTSAAEVLTGGAGNDIYHLTPGDQVVELASGGTDTVNASFTHILAGNVENLILTGNAAINGIGNLLANRLTGNEAANQLVGGLGMDSLFGNGGNDTLSGGTDGDLLDGGIGNDWLDGGAGADTLRGGTGDDVYVLDSTADVISEYWNQGTDTVRASMGATLGVQVENLVLLGTANLWGTGNTLHNVLTGNAGANSLDGGAGNDTLAGGEGGDWLNGGAGIDLLRGGAGNDTYVLDNPGDLVAEAAGQGTDTVRSSVTVQLSANVENLILTGNAAINGTGNALNNSLTGNAAANQLVAGGGNDILNGAAGQDMLTGGTGTDVLSGGLDAARDVFVFNALSDSTGGAGRDRILDLRSGVDDIDLRALDANTRIAGNQAFDFSGAAADANAVWYVKAGANLIVRADVNGDRVADFEVAVMGQAGLGASDFLL